MAKKHTLKAPGRAAALPTVIFYMAIVGALSVTGAFVARQQSAGAVQMERGNSLDAVAERVIVGAVESWDSASRAAQPVGEWATLAGAVDGELQGTGSILRLSGTTWWIVAEAEASAKPLLRRRLGFVVRSVDGVPQPATPRAWSELP